METVPSWEAGSAERPLAGAEARRERLHGRARRLAFGIALVLVLVGGVTVLGWMLGVEAMTRPLPGFVSMKANTGCSLLFFGAGLAYHVRHPDRRGVTLAGALVPTALGALTLVEYTRGVDLGIDQLFARDVVAPGTVHPGRMSPYTALAVVLGGIGVASLPWDARTHLRVSDAAGLGVLMVALLTLNSYIFGASLLVGFNLIAPHTAFALLLLAIALFCVEPTEGLASLFWDPGAAGSLVRPMAAAALGIPVLLGYLRLRLDRAGVFGGDVPLGTAAYATAIVVTLWLLVLVAAARVRTLDAERARLMRQELDVARLKELDAYRTEFVNHAAHELRTPLLPLRANLRTLRANGNLTPDQAKILEGMDRGLGRFADLVEDLLDSARYQAGQLELRPTQTDMATIAAHVAADFKPLAAERGLALTVEVAGDTVVRADEKKLRQVMANLVSNAVKFTPSGSVHMMVHGKPETVDLTVTDTGIGIAEADLPRLFRPFSQVHDVSQSTYPGTGLGLYLSRGFAELHGGTLSAASAGLRRGSTFTLSIPRKAEAVTSSGGRGIGGSGPGPG